MRKKKTSLLKTAGEAVALGALALTSRCIEKIENRKKAEPMDEEKLNRQLTVLSVVFHAIGIFYNE